MKNIKIRFGRYRGFIMVWSPFGKRPKWKATHEESEHEILAETCNLLHNRIDLHECPCCQHGRGLKWNEYR